MPKLVYIDTVLPLDTTEVVLGRHRECTLQVDDAKASRRHARLFPDKGVWWIEDLESANGTTLNGKPFTGRRPLSHEDSIGIGKSRIQFLAPETVQAVTREKRSAAVQGVAGNPDVLLGRMLGGCELRAVLGKSRLGAVYRARQAALNRDVAIKVFTADASGRADFAERLLPAVRRASAVHHQYLLQLHDCGRDDEISGLWYSMELVEGETLADLLARDGTVAPAVAALVVERTALALQALHAAGLVHRDVTPRNVLITPSGQIKLSEPGLAEALAIGRGSAGDPAFTAPEGAVDARSDLYSLGCLFFTLLTGQPPFAGDDAAALAKAHREAPIPNLRDAQPKLPAKLDELVHGLLAKNPEWRHASVQELLAELAPLRAELQLVPAAHPAGGAAASATPVDVDARISKARGRRVRSGLITAAVWIAILGGAGLVVSRLPAWKNAEPAPAATPAQSAPSVPAQTSGTTGTRPLQPAPVTTVVADPLTDRWREVQAAAEADAASGDWGAAERELARFAATPGLPPAITDALRLTQSRLQIDGEAWYQAEIAKLPADLTASLSRLALLRDVAITGERGDAEARYQEVQARLLQRLNAARRAARQAVESGKNAELPALGAGLEPVFRGTPIAGLQHQFASACSEAAPAARFWQGSWPNTRVALGKAAGADALPAAAALLLAGEVATAKRLLADPALASGDLLRRREALLGREAAVLTFNDPGDLQFIESALGELRFDGGALTGPAGEAVALSCTVPIGGADWEAGLTLDLADAPGAQAQTAIAVMHGETPEAMVKLTAEGMLARVHAADGWQEQLADRPSTAPLRLRLVCRGGTLQVTLAGQSVLEVVGARVPAGSRLVIDVAGAVWKLDELQVVGGD